MPRVKAVCYLIGLLKSVTNKTLIFKHRDPFSLIIVMDSGRLLFSVHTDTDTDSCPSYCLYAGRLLSCGETQHRTQCPSLCTGWAVHSNIVKVAPQTFVFVRSHDSRITANEKPALSHCKCCNKQQIAQFLFWTADSRQLRQLRQQNG